MTNQQLSSTETMALPEVAAAIVPTDCSATGPSDAKTIDGENTFANDVELRSMIDNVPSEYEVVSLISRGTDGAAFKVRHKQFNTMFVFRTLRPYVRIDLVQNGQFEREAEIAKSMWHANLDTIYAYGFGKSGAPYIVSSCLEGESLRQLLRKKRSMPLSQALEVFIQIASAVEYAHDMGLPCAINLSDIIVHSSDKGGLAATLVGFGTQQGLLEVQRASEDPLEAELRQREQANFETDPAPDIYSFGCLMYETVLGHAPSQARAGRPQSLSIRENKAMFPFMIQVIWRCLTSQLPRRYNSFTEILFDLTQQTFRGCEPSEIRARAQRQTA